MISKPAGRNLPRRAIVFQMKVILVIVKFFCTRSQIEEHVIKKILIYPILMFLLASGNSFADEISSTKQSAEEQRESIFSYVQKVKGTDERLWQFKTGGMYERHRGNTDTLNSDFITNFEYDDETLEVEFDFKGFYQKDAGEIKEKNWRVEFHLGYYLLQRLELTAYTISEYNRMALVDHRNYTCAGPKIIFFKNYFWKIDITGAPTRLYSQYSGFQAETT